MSKKPFKIFKPTVIPDPALAVKVAEFIAGEEAAGAVETIGQIAGVLPIYTDAELREMEASATTLEDRLKRNEPVRRSIDGVFQTDVWLPRIRYNPSENETVLPAGDLEARAQVVFGFDKPIGSESGFGSVGAQEAGKIDLVCGRMATFRNALEPVGANRPVTNPILSTGQAGEIENTVLRAHNSFSADAARVYISQMSKIDDYFGIAEGVAGPNVSIGKSAVGIKADGVRIIGREGVKIVSGPALGVKNFGEGETNSLGGKISKGPPIELIAGNITGKRPPTWGGLAHPREEIDYLQPIPLGANTRDALFELHGIIEEITAALKSFVITQRRINKKVNLGLAAAAAPSAVAIPAVQVITKMIGLQNLILGVRVKSPIWHTRINNILWRINYLEPYGYKYICSRDVFTT